MNLNKGESFRDVTCQKVENVGEMPGFSRNLSSSNEDVSFEELIKDQTYVCKRLHKTLK